MTIDWSSIWVPSTSIGELVVRGVVMYFLVLALLRVVLRRQVGGIGTTDVLVIVLVSEVAGRAFGPETRSITESAVMVLVILLCSFASEWLQYRFPLIERLMREPKLKLIEEGRLLHRNMRREFVTKDELMTQVRENGLKDYRDVKAAYMEANGRISVIPKKK